MQKNPLLIRLGNLSKVSIFYQILKFNVIRFTHSFLKGQSVERAVSKVKVLLYNSLYVPYGLPLSHFYSEEDNKIYFHGAKEGHKIDAIKNYDKESL